MPTAALPDAPVGADTAKKIRSFLDRFVDAYKSPAETAALFADDAQYYGRGVVGRKTIMREVARYNAYWPCRMFRVREISYMTADPGPEGVFVAYTIDFEVADSMRSIAGQAHYAALIEDADGTPKMRANRERVVQRIPGIAGAGFRY